MSASDINSVTEQLSQASVVDSSLLSFAGRSLKLDTEADAEEIVKALRACDRLSSFELKGNTLGVSAAKAIGTALGGQSSLKRALWSDLFTGRLKSEIPNALKFLCEGMMKAGTRLVELDLSDNAFGPNGMVGLTDFLKSSSCYSLRELRLNNNGLGITGGKMLAESLLACHTASVAAGTPLALEVFVSGRGRLEDEGALALSQAFKAMKSLVEVHMPQNGINARGITALAEAFALNPNLRHINLSDNTFTEKGSLAMAQSLPLLSHLEVINFDDCLIRTGGAKAIAEALAKNNDKLKVLKLSGNEISSPGAIAVAEAVANKAELEELDLNTNQLGSDGVSALKKLMKTRGLADKLMSLSDDEGTEDEGEDDESDDDEKDDENENEDDDKPGQDGDENDEENDSGEEVAPDSGLEIVGQALKSSHDSTKSNAVDEFLKSPSAAKLQKLGQGHKPDVLIEYLKDSVSQPETAVGVFMKISSVVSESDERTTSVAKDFTDCLLSTAFSHAEKSATSSVLCNSLLVHLGMIKSEDKTFRPMANVDGALLLLSHAVQQKYFPKAVKDTLTFFTSRSVSTSSSSFSQKLLQTLKGQ